MSTAPNTAPRTGGFKLTEDWLATLIGLALALVIGLGVLGPGGQNVGLKAAPGTTAQKAARPLSGWSISATLGGSKATVMDAPKALESGKTYIIACQNDQLALRPTDSTASTAPSDRALIVLVNDCTTDAAITYRTSALIPWPLFRLF